MREFKFKELFNEMGWNNDRTNQPIAVESSVFTLKGVAEKSGFKILVCTPSSNESIPEYSIRRKIEAKVTKLFQEHLIIFVDAKQQEQIWLLVVRQTGRPTKATETRYHITQDPELLFQRASGIFFELDEEERITIVDVTRRVTENFYQNNERVTKQFYERFSNEHASFLKFIKGIEDNVSKEWYASLMLNRLMFCYFIQKKGFLDNNKNYLWDKLKSSQRRRGNNKFYSFYRSFLLTLFHQGLGAPDRSNELKEEIGRVPYLNGGLFEEHELETINPSIDIGDRAFERIFEFFDQYEWHLDTRHTASGKDINPDVIGYIFEKYINDRADMGAYYTKEDITDYISKNCVLPYLLDESKRNYPGIFGPKGEIWQMVKTSGDQYIYDAVKHGVTVPLPKVISKGIKDVAQRSEWNKPAPEEFALPSEIWREVVERRTRYEEVKGRIENGEVQTIDDFITYNLNISQFVQDVVESTNDTEFLKTLYKALNSVTIIDPTCGSGAFLFAAMNILEPLYEACIMRMRACVEDEDRINKEDKVTFSHKHKYFREVLKNIQSPQHPNLQYFIYKSIILRNLFGVDIMKEAVEIAKLRLFLRLVATVEPDYRKPNLGLEPLPDIDFNIRAGNTLIGFATEAELNKGLTYTLDGLQAKPAVEEKMETVAKAYTRYKDIQLTYGDDYLQFKKAKEELNKRLKELNHELNQLLYKQTPAIKYDKWLATHQPFHWFAEFYEIIHDRKGFDIIIGNPPYVEYSKVKREYTISNYQTESCGNLYAFVMERAVKILKERGKLGVIIPLASFSTKRMMPLQNLYTRNGNYLYISNYEATSHPTVLFVGVNVQLSIIFWEKRINGNATVHSTAYRRCYSTERVNLFHNILFAMPVIVNGYITRLSKPIEQQILRKMFNQNSIGNHFGSSHPVYYRNMGNFYYKLAFDDIPKYFKDGKLQMSSTVSILNTRSKTDKYCFISIINSTLFYYYWILFSDCYHLSKSDISSFPLDLDLLPERKKEELLKLATDYLSSIEETATWQVENKKDGSLKRYRRYFPQNSKPVSDKIDKILAKHYGFTDEELDFIINYDIKYRLGLGGEDDDE